MTQSSSSSSKEVQSPSNKAIRTIVTPRMALEKRLKRMWQMTPRQLKNFRCQLTKAINKATKEKEATPHVFYED